MMNQKISRWLNLAAVLFFTAAVFQITNNHFILGAVFMGAAACELAAAGMCRKNEESMKDGRENGTDGNAADGTSDKTI